MKTIHQIFWLPAWTILHTARRLLCVVLHLWDTLEKVPFCTRCELTLPPWWPHWLQSRGHSANTLQEWSGSESTPWTSCLDKPLSRFFLAPVLNHFCVWKFWMVAIETSARNWARPRCWKQRRLCLILLRYNPLPHHHLPISTSSESAASSVYLTSRNPSARLLFHCLRLTFHRRAASAHLSSSSVALTAFNSVIPSFPEKKRYSSHPSVC